MQSIQNIEKNYLPNRKTRIYEVMNMPTVMGDISVKSPVFPPPDSHILDARI